MALEEVVEDTNVEADRVPAARQLLARGEENAVVRRVVLGGSADQEVVVGPVCRFRVGTISPFQRKHGASINR